MITNGANIFSSRREALVSRRRWYVKFNPSRIFFQQNTFKNFFELLLTR